MNPNAIARTWITTTLAVLGCGFASLRLAAQAVVVDPGKMPAMGTVDERFQSYNIEMVEVTGGRFWKPYSSQTESANKPEPAQQPGSTPTGVNPSLFQYRPPIDLANSRLRRLAAALGPAYLRVSGTWANSVHFHDSDDPPPANAPSGFGGVLTREQWKGVIDFAHAVNAEIVTSVATSPGTRDANGIWTPEEARKLLAYTRSSGGRIAATEFMNEPNLAAFGGAPRGYDAAVYGRDISVFRPFLKQNSPNTVLLGPGSVTAGPPSPASSKAGLETEDLLKTTGPVFDVFSYHLYSAVSQRCAKTSAALQTTPADALSPDWLSRPENIATFYAGLRDRFEPGKPLWITETADAACGGNPWAATFVDTFRYLVQHARLAQQGVKVIMHNTLAASDYGLLDENTFAPRPNYWAALLWRKLMGATVLDAHTPPAENVYAYAHCQRDHRGSVALLIINADQQRTFDLTLPSESDRYTLDAATPEDAAVRLNGNPLTLQSNDDLPQLKGQRMHAGRVRFAPRSITFLAIAGAKNSACR